MSAGGGTAGGGVQNTESTNASSLFTLDQLQQLRAQVVAYRMLSTNQPLTPQIMAAVQGRRVDGPVLNGNPYQQQLQQQPRQGMLDNLTSE